jgi:hypothetical protein
VADILNAMMPENIFAAAADGKMLPVVIFASLFALALTRVGEVPRRQMMQFFEALAGAMMVIVGWVLMLAPLGVFGLAVALGAKTGADAIGALAHYIVVVSAAGFVVLLGGYVLAVTVGRRKLGDFARAMVPVNAVAISTQSSLASLPAMLAATRRLGVREATADFVLPMAVAIFRATSPAMNMGVAIYAAHLTGTPLTAAALMAGVFVAFLVSLSSVSLTRHDQLRDFGRPDRDGDGCADRPLGAVGGGRNVARYHAHTGQCDAGRGGYGCGGSRWRLGHRLGFPQLHLAAIGIDDVGEPSVHFVQHFAIGLNPLGSAAFQHGGKIIDYQIKHHIRF